MMKHAASAPTLPPLGSPVMSSPEAKSPSQSDPHRRWSPAIRAETPVLSPTSPLRKGARLQPDEIELLERIRSEKRKLAKAEMRELLDQKQHDPVNDIVDQRCQLQLIVFLTRFSQIGSDGAQSQVRRAG